MAQRSLQQVLIDNIERAMDEARLSGNALAKRAGISQTHLAKVLRGEAVFSISILAEVAKGLGCDPWELLVESEAVRERAIRRLLSPQSKQAKSA